MDSLTRENVYFTNLLEKGSNMSIDFILESPQAEVCTEQFSSETQLESIAKKPTRGIKFTVDWEKIYEYFQKEKTSYTSRTANSLMQCWSTIQLKTNKFVGA
jgi:hypothetical protein